MSENTRLPGGALARLLAERSRGSSSLHRQFLQGRSRGLTDMQAILARQIAAMQATGPSAAPAVAAHAQTAFSMAPAIFTSSQLDAFGTGKISDCLGPAFAQYDQRRIPRIPNGDLKMMSRITAIQGQPQRFDLPATVTAEYDLPWDAWFLQDGLTEMPFSLWMETALQPCGFLSAYLDFIPWFRMSIFTSATWMAGCGCCLQAICAGGRLPPRPGC